MLKLPSHSQLMRSSVVYTTASVVNAAIPFLIMPVLTRYLTPADYGIVAMLGVLVGIISPFIGLNLHGAVMVKHFQSGSREIARYVGNCFFLLLASTAAVSLILWLFAGVISAGTSFPVYWLPTVVLVCAGQFIVLILLTLWQAKEKPFHYGILQVLQTLFNIALTLFLVVTLGMNWKGRICAQVLTVLIFSIAAFFILQRSAWIRFSYNKNDISHALRFGVPLIPHALGGMLIVQTDRIFITNMLSVADTGIYTVGLQLGMIVELLASSFNKAYVPWLYQRLNQDNPEIKRTIVRGTYAYFAGILFFAVLLAVFMPWFMTFFVGSKFLGASKYTSWIALGFAFSGMYYMVANYLFFADSTHLLARITFLTAVLNIILNYVLIRLNGAIGAAQASAITLFISFILTWRLSAKVHPMPWTLSRPLKKWPSV